jgi:hypothetical protein
MQGVILAWYLPGILESSRQVSVFTCSITVTYLVFQNEMLAAMKKLDEILCKPNSTGPWCRNNEYFNPEAEGPLGVLDVSPACFQQGHDVS